MFRGKVLTGKDNKAEGESLNVLGWVSPIASGLGGGGRTGAEKHSGCQFSTHRPTPGDHTKADGPLL